MRNDTLSIYTKVYKRQNLYETRDNKVQSSPRKLYRMTNKAPKVPKLKLPRPPTPDYKSDRIYHNNRFIDSETYMMEIKERPVE